MKRLFRVVPCLVLVFGLASAALAQSLESYASLKDPRIVRKPAQLMLVVEGKGDPSTAAQVAMATLFRAFYKIPFAKMAAPRSRWSDILTSPKAEWSGLFGLPIPDDTKGLPEGVTGVRIETWAYGEVAEILHVGRYDNEGPTVERLMKLIADKGYAVAGPHEEEYLAGPGMVAEPEKYQTIIRYQVKKK
jgi:hypothetical protein